MISLLLFVLGLLILVGGSSCLVDGATCIARRFHLSELLIGATVVAIGTTLPEVTVSVTSAVLGHGEMAYGNAIGSIICNTALIAAITIVVAPSLVDRKTIRIPVIFFFLAAAIFSAAAYTTGIFSRWLGVGLLALFVVYMIANAWGMNETPSEENPEPEERAEKSLSQTILRMGIGIVLVALGARMSVEGGTSLASLFGLPESVIALTLVALGTSLPELATAVTALLKGHAFLSLGNVIGANVLNLVLVCGASMAVSPFTIPESTFLFGVSSSLILDLPLMFITMLILSVPALTKGRLYRAQGIILLGIYLGFSVIQYVI